MNSSIRWRRVPGALLWHLRSRFTWAELAVVASIVLVCGNYLRTSKSSSLIDAQATSVTPITSTSDAASGITFSGDAYEVTCTVSTDTVTLYAAMHDGSAWRIYDGTSCALAVGAGRTCRFPAERQTGQTWNAYKTGSGSVASCTARQVFGPLGRRPATGGGGGGDAGRTAPDSDDVVVWYDYLGGSSWNATVGGSANNLTIVSTSGPFEALGVFGDSMFAPSPFLDTSTGGVGYGSTTTAGEGSAFTASAWIYVRAVPDSTPGIWPIVGKQNADGDWGPPYATWHLSLVPGTGTSGTADLGAGIWLVGGAGVVPQASGVSPGLHHVGLTVDSSYARLYLDGVLADSKATGASPDWFSHGPYFVGGLKLTAYSRGWSAQSVGDVRVARVARAGSYFSSVYATRRTVAAVAVPLDPTPPAPLGGADIGPLADSIIWAKAQVAPVRRGGWPATALNVRWTGTTWIYASGPLPGGRWKPSAADEAATDWVRA